MFRIILSLLIVIPVFSLLSCKEKPAKSVTPQIAVSILPQEYLVKYIAGDNFDIQVMLPRGSNHETYEPTPQDMAKISSSKIYFELGALDFELAWLKRFEEQNPEMQVVNTSENIAMINGHEHVQKSESTGEIQGVDPHTWLSPSCMKIQAANICNALSAIDTGNADFYKANLDKFIHLADSVDAKIREKLASSAGKTVLIFHPMLAYFARDYNIDQLSIEKDGKEPSPADMGELIKSAKLKGIKAVLISKEFDTRNAEAIAREIKGKVVVFDPMAENWPDNMVHLADLIAEN
jgi:zinc transport system substrate-binding protein